MINKRRYETDLFHKASKTWYIFKEELFHGSEKIIVSQNYKLYSMKKSEFIKERTTYIYKNDSIKILKGYVKQLSY